MNCLTFITLLCGVLFGVVHTINETHYLYWFYPGLEYVMHVWGGIVMYLFLQSVLELSFIPQKVKKQSRYTLLILAGTMVSWEVFGIYRYGGFKPHYGIDTSLDIAFGILGCIFGWLIYRLIKKRTT